MYNEMRKPIPVKHCHDVLFGA